MNRDPTPERTPRGDSRSDDASVLPIAFLILVILVGTLYTLRQCALLLQQIRGKHQQQATTAASQQVEHLAVETRRSQRAQHHELEEELRSVQQLQAEVKTQLADLRHMVALYQASQQRQNSGRKQD